MKLYSMKLYHGSPHDFDQFDTEHIGGGEGHQVHGWGLYFAEDKEIVATRYAERLARRNVFIRITVDGKEYDYQRDFVEKSIEDNVLPKMLAVYLDTFDSVQASEEYIRKKLEGMKDKDPNEQVYAQGLPKQFGGGVMPRIKYMEMFKESLEFLKHHFVMYEVVIPESKIYTVEVPDDLVFLDEDEFPPDDFYEKIGISKYSDKLNEVVNVIEEYINSHGLGEPDRFSSLDSFIYLVASNLLEKSDAKYYIAMGYGEDIASDLFEQLSKISIESIPVYLGKETYDELSEMKNGDKETSLYLEQHGINGITYWGNTDGRCYVIFNPKNINIVEKE